MKQLLFNLMDLDSRTADLLDRASFDTEREYTFRIRTRESRLIKKITEALQAIEYGEFGICQRCGEKISLARLKARPVTQYCIRCKSELEKWEKAAGMQRIHCQEPSNRRTCFKMNKLCHQTEAGVFEMKKRHSIRIVIGLLLIGSLTVGQTVYAADVTLIGEINDTQQLVTADQLYEIGPGELGDFLVTKLISVKVKVYGELVETDEVKTIMVKKYEVMQE